MKEKQRNTKGEIGLWDKTNTGENFEENWDKTFIVKYNLWPDLNSDPLLPPLTLQALGHKERTQAGTHGWLHL